MKAIKHTALALAMALTVGAMTPAHAAGVPVIDVASIAEAIRQYEQMVAQLEQLEGQLNQAKQQYESMTGTRGMERLMSGENRNAIPTSWQETLQQMTGDGSAISGLSQSIKQQAGLVDASTIDQLNEASRGLVNGANNAAIGHQASAGTAYDNAAERFGRLQELMDAIPTAQDPKAIADLQARIAVESTMLQNETIKLQALAQVASSQQAIQQQQIQQKLIQANSGTGRPQRNGWVR